MPVTFDDLPDAPASSGGVSFDDLPDVGSGQSVKAQPYTTSAIGRDLGSLKDAAFGNDATPEYSGDEGDFAKGLRSVPIAGPLLANIGHGIGSLASSAYDTAMDSRATAQADVQKNGVFPAMAHQAGAIALAAPGAIYNTINPVANLIEKAGTDAVSDGARAIGGGLRIAGFPNAADAYSNAAANFEAQKNADKLDVRQNYEQPIQQGILNLSPNPALTTTTQNIAPLLIPAGVGLETAGVNARIGAAIGDGIESAITSPLGDMATSAASHGLPGGGLLKRYVLKPALTSIAPKIGGTVGDLTTLGLNAATPAATGAVLGLAGADPGQEVEGARAGLAQGALFSPISALHGTFARQGMEQADLARQAAIRGMEEYGNNPDLDAATARGIASLDPDQQKAVFEQRGLFRDIKNPEGKQIQIHVPDNYAEGAQAANGGTVDDAANSRGYYLDGQGKVFINPDGSDVPGALQQALGHEVGHSVYQDALPAVNARASERLTNAVTGQALDANLQPTPGFQSFINQYAEAAGSGPVDWNKLPVSGPGLTRNYLLNELGAETVRAATPEVGKQLAGRELSDKVGDFASDMATRLGLKPAPDATAILGPDGQPVPLSVSALQAARKGTYAIGQQAREGFDSPVRIADADPAPRTPVQSQQATPTASDATVNPNQGTPSISSPQPDTPFRQTQAYKDALDVATLDKRYGGLGIKAKDAQILLDRAAQDPAVPNTNTDYIGYIQKARTPVIPPKTAPNLAPVQAATPAENAPTLAPVASAQPAAPILAQNTPQATEPLGPPTPIGTSEGKRINLLYGAKRLEVPTATQPVLTLPKVTPKTELPPVEPVNRFAGMDEPLSTGPTDTREASMTQGASPAKDAASSEQTSGPDSQIPRQGETSNRGTPAPNEDQVQGASPNPTPDTSAPESPLSAAISKTALDAAGTGSNSLREALGKHGEVQTLYYDAASHNPTFSSAPKDSFIDTQTAYRVGNHLVPSKLGDPVLRPKDIIGADVANDGPLANAKELRNFQPPTIKQVRGGYQIDQRGKAEFGNSKLTATSDDSLLASSQQSASPLSSANIARIESEAEAAHQPNPYPRSSPESRAQKQAADLAKAKADAVAKAHADALPPEDDRVRAVVDPDTGAVKLSGKRFVDGDAFHDQLLRNATDGEKSNLSTVQDAIGQGKALNFDYDSALPLRGEDTNAQRKESQALSTATDREQGVGLAQEANHTFIPLSASPTASGHAQVYGYAPDKVLGNAETAIRLMRDSGLSDRLPYTGINDPSLTADIRAYTENHVNGYKGDGSAKLQPTEGVSVPAGDPNYQPQPLPPAKAHFINLIMGQDDTLSQKQEVKTGPNAGNPTNSATLRNFAAANDNVPSAAGEVNPLRDELNRKGVLKVGNDKGSGEVLHSAFENIKPGLITRFHDQPGTSEVPPLRASSFEGDRGSIAPGGKVPNRQASAAGFLPSREPLDTDAREALADERAERYFGIGHEEGGQSWIYNPSSRSVKSAEDTTHGAAFGHDVSDRSFKGRYDPDQGVISVVFPESERRKLGGAEPTEDDIPTGVYKALENKFGKGHQIVSFLPAREAGAATPEQPMSESDSRAMVEQIRAGDASSKNKGIRYGDEGKTGSLKQINLPLSAFDAPMIEHLRDSTDEDRVDRYAKENVQTPVFAKVSRRNGRLIVSDGGHRILAAIKRGDKTIPALVPADYTAP